MKKLIFLTVLMLCVFNLKAEKEWVMVSPPFGVYDDNFGIYCYDSLSCIAFTDIYEQTKLIQRSYDGGKTWAVTQEFDYSDTPIDSADRPYRTHIFDSLQYYTVYFDGEVIDRSTDGGKSFERINLVDKYVDRALDNLKMYSKNIGVTHNLGWIYYTHDNWDTFTTVNIPSGYYLDLACFFIDSNSIAFINLIDYDDPSEYMTNFVKYDIANNEFSVYSNLEIRGDRGRAYVNNITRVNDSVLYACGNERTGLAHYAYDLVWKTTDNGLNWERLLRDSSGQRAGLDHIDFRNEDHGIAVGSWSNIIETTDGGETWKRYPDRKEMASLTSEISWAGETALFAAYATGIFRLETKTPVEYLSSNSNIKVNQFGNNLEIAINDKSYSHHELQLFNLSGQQLQTNILQSSDGFLYQTIPLVSLVNGVYFYTISKNGANVFNGKFIILGE